MKPPPIVRKPTAVFHQTGALELGEGKITGVIALMLSVNPNLSPLQVRTILESTADDISGVGFTYKSGYGRVNAYKAVRWPGAASTRQGLGDEVVEIRPGIEGQ